MIHHLTRATRHLLFWSLILAAIGLSAVRVLLSTIDDYKVELEQKISQTAGLPLHIGQMRTSMRGFSPELILSHIQFDADAKGQTPIQLKEVRVGVDLLELLVKRDLLAASRVTLVGAKIGVIRQADGRFSIKGLQASDEQPLWLLQGAKYEILQSEISWQDLMRHGQEVHFEHFDLVLKNHYLTQIHEVHLQSRLPEQYGDSLRISAEITGNIFEANAIEGRLYLEGENLHAADLLTGDLPWGLKVDSADGNVKLWSDWQNSKPYRLVADVKAQQIRLRQGQQRALQFDTFDGVLSWREDQGNTRVAGYGIEMFVNHRHLSTGDFCIQFDQQGGLAAQVQQLDLQTLTGLAPVLLPVESSYRQALKLAPTGVVSRLSFFSANDLQRYALTADISDWHNAPWQDIPGLAGVNAHIEANQHSGVMRLNGIDSVFDAPQLFRNDLALQRLEADIHWWRENDDWQVASDHLIAENTDIKTDSQLQLRLPASGESPILAMRTRLGSIDDMSKAPLYLPAKIMGTDVVDWLDHAFVSGKIPQGEMLLYGRLDQFPYESGNGHFEVLFEVEQARLRHHPQWPHLQEMNAQVLFIGNGLEVAIESGSSEKVAIKQAFVAIPSFTYSDHLLVNGQGEARIDDALQFLQKTPLKERVDGLSALLSTEGSVPVDLDLQISLTEKRDSKARVSARLNNARLTVKPINLAVERINGELQFSENGMTCDRLDALSLGSPIRGQIINSEKATLLQVEGRVSVDKLQQQFSFLQGDNANGAFDYKLQLNMPFDKQPSRLNIETDLQGMQLDSNNQLAKAAEDKVPLQLDFQFAVGKELPMHVRYGERLQASLAIDKQQQRILGGHVVLGAGDSEWRDNSALHIDIRQPTFKLSQAFEAFSASNAKTAWPEIKSLSIDTQQLIWQGQDFGALRLAMQKREHAWQGSIDSGMAKGSVVVPDNLGSNERIRLRMDMLNLSELSNLNFAPAESHVDALPLIDIDSQHLLWRSLDLGQLHLQTERLPNGVHFKTIKLNSANKTIDLSADWIKRGNGSVTQLNGRLRSDAFGQLLSDLGFSDDIEETHADLSFNGGWNGGPHQFSLARLNGQLKLKLTDGRITSIEPGFGRLLGLIAMEQWAKRVSLDFSDVYRQGLAFDEITGRVKIVDGFASTDDLLVDAVAAQMSISGSANLVDKTLNQRVAVVPKSAGAIPIAGTIVGGVTRVITEILTDDYKEGYFFGSEYQISGQWGDLQVIPVHDGDGLLKKTWRGLTEFDWLK